VTSEIRRWKKNKKEQNKKERKKAKTTVVKYKIFGFGAAMPGGLINI